MISLPRLVQADVALLKGLGLEHSHAVDHQKQQQQRHDREGQQMQSRWKREIVEMVDQKQSQRRARKQLNGCH